MRIYISGAITGEPNYKNKFKQAVKKARELFPLDIIVNPAKLPGIFPEGTHDDYMEICMIMLKKCDTVCLIPGWENSVGATEEHDFAIRAGKFVVYLHGI